MQGDDVHLISPGFFGAKWGRMTPVGLLMGHAVYGLIGDLGSPATLVEP